MSALVVVGVDGLARCTWGASNETYVAYHDTEWGRAVLGEQAVYERMCLEGFQAGLSWITILRKRNNFRAAFADFDPSNVAKFDEDDVARLLNDVGIVRHRGKIEATINNARVLLALNDAGESLSDIVWGYHNPALAPPHLGPQTLADVPAKTAASVELSKRLLKLGFRFVGPTTMYAAMQAMGIVNDHAEGCHVRHLCIGPTTTA